MNQAERDYFRREQEQHEAHYLAGATAQQQSGFGLGSDDWERFRHPIVEPIHKDGSFLDIGCANGLLMEDVAAWSQEEGHCVDVYGLDISEKLAGLARRRLPHWGGKIFVGNALFWEPPTRFDFVRTELVYVPPTLRRGYIERLMDLFLAPGGKLIVCSYGSSRPEGTRAEPLGDEIRSWGLPISSVHEAMSFEHSFAITRVVAIDVHGQRNTASQPSVSQPAVDRANRKEG